MRCVALDHVDVAVPVHAPSAATTTRSSGRSSSDRRRPAAGFRRDRRPYHRLLAAVEHVDVVLAVDREAGDATLGRRRRQASAAFCHLPRPAPCRLSQPLRTTSRRRGRPRRVRAAGAADPSARVTFRPAASAVRHQPVSAVALRVKAKRCGHKSTGKQRGDERSPYVLPDVRGPHSGAACGFLRATGRRARRPRSATPRRRPSDIRGSRRGRPPRNGPGGSRATPDAQSSSREVEADVLKGGRSRRCGRVHRESCVP